MFVKIKVDFFNEKHLGKERAKENGESTSHWERWTAFFRKYILRSKVASVLWKWQCQEKNLDWEVFSASKYKRWIDFQHPLPLSDL